MLRAARQRLLASLPVLVAVSAALGLAAAAPAARAASATEVQAQAQAAWYAGDAGALQALAAATANWASSQDAEERYAHAFVQFRRLQLAVTGRRTAEAEAAGKACVAATPPGAEGSALQSACYGYLAGAGGTLAAIRNGRASGKAIDAALAAAPRNPRVILVDAFGLTFRPKIAGGDPVKGCARFREAAAAFDATAEQSPNNGGSPGTANNNTPIWGHAEAHYWVGRCAARAGDTAAARAAYARALELAPQFKAAQRASL
ncbi:MAG: tetratricopeptide repeat protein [Steroidobacteraceae bacterium]|nr:tetratricopeptide repeat protein [Steroidobacteraceae bacterium]MDW8258106.1 tetratricopeptide repeat protein [Gammaproteobacteria bacterium]